MFSVFLELVKRVGIFVIIGQTILHFGISKEYEKYMKLVVSFMVAAQVVFAFTSYIKKEENDSWMISSKEYYQRWEENMQDLEEEFLERQDVLNKNLEQRFQTVGEGESGDKQESFNEIKVEKIEIK